MTATKKKTRRKRKSKCVKTSKFSVEGAPFKDEEQNGLCICAGGTEQAASEKSEPHILFQVERVELNPMEMLESIMRVNVGVDHGQLLNADLEQEVDFRPLLPELLSLFKQHKRLHVYRNLAFQEIESIFSIDSKSETYSKKVVFHTLYYILYHVVPVSLLGSRRNFKAFMKSVRRIVYGCYKQRLSLSSLLHGIKVRDITWLQNALPSNSLRLHTLARLVKWLLMWVQNIIVSLWHVSIDSSKEVIFYNKSKYQSMTQKELNSLQSQGKIKRVSEDYVKSKIKDLGQLQFLRKSSGMRPITKFPKSANTERIRTDARMLLVQMAFLNGSTYTSFSPRIDEILHRGILRILKCHPDPTSRPPYFFVRVDVRDAFGSIDHRKLLTLLQELNKKFLPSDLNMKVWNMKRGARQQRMFECEKMPLPRNMKWTKLGSAKIERIDAILHHIRDAVHRLGVKAGKQLFRICSGLPQGMHLSGVLSELYYSSLDIKLLQQFQKSMNDELFIRYCDDYFFMTPSKERADLFFQKMSTGFSEFNFEINPEKTATNLTSDTSIVSFCGFTINLNNFCVQGNFENYRHCNLSNKLNLSKTKKLGRVLKSRMKLILKLHPVLLERKINSKHTVAQNLYHAALFMAFRFAAFVQSCFLKSKINQRFLVGCIQLGERAFIKRVPKASDECCPGKSLSIPEIKWIVYRAFLARMRNTPCTYSNVLRCMSRRIEKISQKLNENQIKLLSWACTPALPGVFSTMKWYVLCWLV